MSRRAGLPAHNPNCFIGLKTGPWEGPGSWLYKVFCVPCDWHVLETCYDDASDARQRHRDGEGVKELTPTKVPNSRKAAARKRVLERQKEEEVEWEVFF